MTWYENRPELLKDVQDSIQKSGQALRLKKSAGQIQVIGTWKVNWQNEIVDSYHLKIVFPDDYPVGAPQVYETSNKIPRTKERHLTPHRNWEACLFVSLARWEVWPLGESFYKFLMGPLSDFFISQSYFELHKKWPFGDYLHEMEGQIQYLKQKLNLIDNISVLPFLNFLINTTGNATNAKCPCKSKKKVSDCHKILNDLCNANLSQNDLIKIKDRISPPPKKLKKPFRANAFRKFF